MLDPANPLAPPPPESITIALAAAPAEIEAAQRLRYKVFYEEYGATPDDDMKKAGRDMDFYDSIADHLVVKDTALGTGPDAIIGTYRLLRRDIAEAHRGFYTSDEFDLGPLLEGDKAMMELGRSCVLAPYRTRAVLQKLWEGIAHYVAKYDIALMFGCASLHGTDPGVLKTKLAYLYHYHLAPPALRTRALPHRYVEMNTMDKNDFSAKEQFMALPPLIKGYMRLGAYVGNGAVVDYQFNTTDVCIIMPTHMVTARYNKHYSRTTGKDLSGGRYAAFAAEPTAQPVPGADAPEETGA